MSKERTILRGDSDGELPADEPVRKTGFAISTFRAVLAVSILMPILASSIWLTAWIISNLPTR